MLEVAEVMMEEGKERPVEAVVRVEDDVPAVGMNGNAN